MPGSGGAKLTTISVSPERGYPYLATPPHLRLRPMKLPTWCWVREGFMRRVCPPAEWRELKEGEGKRTAEPLSLETTPLSEPLPTEEVGVVCDRGT